MTIWFSADLHFGHKWMALTHRHWGSVYTHDNALMDEWNDTIGPHDEVYYLGDFSFASKQLTTDIWHRLNGHKHLVVGNHDPKYVEQLPWVTVSHIKRVKYEGQSMWCCHYPMLTWPNAHHGTWHLHGHSHGNLRAPESTRIDVGYDAIGKVAISVDEVRTILSQRTYDFIDHHDRGE